MTLLSDNPEFHISELPQPFGGSMFDDVAELFMQTVYKSISRRYWQLGIDKPTNLQFADACGHLDDPNMHIFVASGAEESVVFGALAYLSCSRTPFSLAKNSTRRQSIRYSGYHEIKLLAVNHRFRRLGIGRKLMEYAEDIAGNRSAPGIILNNVLDAGKPLYENMGYQSTPVLFPALQGVRYVKSLSS